MQKKYCSSFSNKNKIVEENGEVFNGCGFSILKDEKLYRSVVQQYGYT
jgi:hypothetical protein